MTSKREQRRREKEAADWFARLSNRTISLADVERFQAWRGDPACRQAYEELEGVWRRSAVLSDDPDIRADLAKVPDRRRPHRRAAAWRPQWILGGMVAAAAAIGLIGYQVTMPARYVTGVGEIRTVRLGDGSRLHLDTDSRVDVRLRGGSRDLVLHKGQALFDVAPDADRPFVVVAGSTAVQALGTRFDVRRDAQGTRVTLIEGRVEVRESSAEDRRWTLWPGEQLRVPTSRQTVGDRSAAIRQVDVVAVAGWTTGRLLFQDTPLTEAIAEVNRYNDAPIVLKAPEVASEPLSGAFDVGDHAAFAEAVARIHGLQATALNDGSIVLSAQPN